MNTKSIFLGTPHFPFDSQYVFLFFFIMDTMPLICFFMSSLWQINLLYRYLLENGADPNIQDKSGKTALMHACIERAGDEVLSLLLSSGADPSLEDHTGSSALVYAVNAGDKDALRVLLDACKAKGKEVIIITTDKLPSGRQMTKQYLNVPPPPNLEDRLHCAPASCMCPSKIKFCTPLISPPTSNQSETQGSTPTLPTPKPGSPTQDSTPLQAAGVAKLLHLQRLHSEPWLKIPPSLLLQQSKSSSLTEELLDITPEEELSFGYNGCRPPLRATVARHQSIDVKDSTGLLRAFETTPDAERELKKNRNGSVEKCPMMGSCFHSLPRIRISNRHPSQMLPLWTRTQTVFPTWPFQAYAMCFAGATSEWTTTVLTLSCFNLGANPLKTSGRLEEEEPGGWRNASLLPAAPPLSLDPENLWSVLFRGGAQPCWSGGNPEPCS